MDAVRGAAMLGVVLAHSAEYLDPGKHLSLSSALVTIGMFATPTFLLLSGTVCGYLRESNARDPRRFRLTILGRGLFLLTLGHLILGLTHWLWQPLAHAMWQSVYITDAVGVGLTIAAFLPRLATPRQLLAAGIALLVLSWTMTLTLIPASEATIYLLRILVGLNIDASTQQGWVVPVIPYLGIFLIGMGGGVEYARRVAQGEDLYTIGKFCLRIGVACVTAACFAKLVWLVAKPHAPLAARPVFHFLTEPRNKIPPGPAYVLAFGGMGVILAGFVYLRHRVLRWLTSAGAVVGQASFLIFVLQYWVISVPAEGFGMHGGLLFWAVALVSATIILWLLAALANRVRFNRLLTFKRLLARVAPST
jgi:acyltransferase-like protein